MPSNPYGNAIFQEATLIAPTFDLVDGKVLNQTTILVGGPPQRWGGMHLFVIGQDITGFSAAPKITIGNNSPNFDNILPQTQLTGLTSTDDCWAIILPKSSKMSIPGLDIVLTVTAIANSTTYLFRAYVIGIAG